MIKQVVCCGLLTLLFSCTYEEAWQTATTATTDNIRQFSLTMPSYMEAAPDNKLNPTAKLQYCNYYRNVYALVLDQNKTDAANTDTSLRQYANRYVRQMTSTMIKPQQIDSANTTIVACRASPSRLPAIWGSSKTCASASITASLLPKALRIITTSLHGHGTAGEKILLLI